MGKWKAVSSKRVDEQTLRALLKSEGASWESVAHVTATASLARSVRTTGTVGLPIATLTDLVVQPGMPDVALPLDGFPGPDVLGRGGMKAYDRAVSDWQQLVTGRRFRLGIRFDDELRRYARTVEAAPDVGRLLVGSRREFSRTVHTLVAAGISPTEMAPSSELGRSSVAAWDWLEHEIPALAAPRNDLWTDLQEFQTQATPHARDLRDRIDLALEYAFGVTQGRRVIVHHGFYFFTPPQWALFQLLRRIPNVDQIFIVHDDGLNPTFETWRRFFVDKWNMPAPASIDFPSENIADITSRADALRCALSGERVPRDGLSRGLSVVECRNPAELVRLWHEEPPSVTEEPPRRFAADAESVERFVGRLGRDAESGPVDLAQLPIGSFLLAIHDCIKPLAGGGVEVVLKDDALLEIAASGFLDDSSIGGSTKVYVGAIRRALPFFKGCRTGEEWLNRARQLHRLVLTEVEPLGGRLPKSTDLERMRLAADNPLRLAPWADLSVNEVVGVTHTIDTTVTLIEDMVSRERIALKVHVQFLQRKLARGMQGLPEDQRREIEAKVQGFSVGLDDEIDVEGLVDIVAMLLGRTADFDSSADLDAPLGRVRDLRGLDSLGMHRLTQQIHITNLADGKFPSVRRSVGWPFRIDDMTSNGASVNPLTTEILKALEENASLSDLYLLWLALDGVEDSQIVTLSWISELASEKFNLSPIVSLLTLPSRGTPAVKARAGGVKLEFVGEGAANSIGVELPSVATQTVTDVHASRVVAKIDPRAGASAVACPRRFALQWMLGQSHAFQSEHHHSILYGNMVGALVKLRKMAVMPAVRAANDLWRYLTPGQRQSSTAKRVVHTHRGSADGLWTLTLGGSRRGSKEIDRAYQAAVDGRIPTLDIIAPAGSEYLPPGISVPSVCGHCPVRDSCISSR